MEGGGAAEELGDYGAAPNKPASSAALHAARVRAKRAGSAIANAVATLTCSKPHASNRGGGALRFLCLN